MTTSAGPPAAGYPVANAVDVALRDGSSIHIRPVQSSDQDALRAFWVGLSSDSMCFRFFGLPSIDWVTKWSIDVDYADRYALVATAGSPGSVIAHGAYIQLGGGRAEVAFVVADAWQGHGIATVMIAHLAAVAERHGIAAFTAAVMPSNHRMVQVFRDSGFPVEVSSEEGEIRIEFPTSLSADARARFHERERLAAVAAVRSFLRPHSVAVIGASRRRRTVGAEILNKLLTGRFSGEVYPVNARAQSLQGHPAFASIADVPGPVELAIVAVPADEVEAVALACGAAGVRALLVVSSGFAEAGTKGADRQDRLLSICRESGMRLIGPNCLGVLSAVGEVRFDATFAPHSPLPGNVGFFSQSGGVGIAAIEAASRFGLGLSAFVSVGNKADVSGNDLLEYWEQDPATDVILLYLESFGNARRFARIARRVSAGKPIIAIKSGRSPAGARATSSHTGALISASDVTVDALFAQAGVIRAETMHELFDVAGLLSAQPAPRGSRIAIVTNAGGPGILCADACQANGLDVFQPDDDVRRELAAFLAPEASVGNPVDMIATASAADYRRVIDVLVRRQVCDAIITIFVPPLVTAERDVIREIALAAQDTGRDAGHVTLVSVFMGSRDSRPAAPDAQGRRVPGFSFPEDAARALGHAARYARWRERPAGVAIPPAGCRPDEAAAIIAAELAHGGGWLAPRAVNALLDCYGLPLIPTRIVADADEAVAAAAELGGPVALKAIARELVHKTDAGGVVLGLHGEGAVRSGARQIEAAVAGSGHQLEALIVQPMAAVGVELLIGVVHDEVFGPVIACGAGGTSAELLGDVAVRITPLSDLDPGEMLRSLRTFPLLDGYRGAAACDVAAVQDVLLRLSELVEAHPEVAEVDLNPVLATPSGACILDARVRIQPTPARRPPFSLPARRGAARAAEG
jgi:acetyl coenzyme A synthetase (ADP forming)-like protein